MLYKMHSSRFRKNAQRPFSGPAARRRGPAGKRAAQGMSNTAIDQEQEKRTDDGLGTGGGRPCGAGA